MKKQLTVMMLGGAKRVSMARMIARAAERRGIAVTLVSYELSEQEPIAKVAEVVKGLRWSDSGVAKHIADELERRRAAAEASGYEAHVALIPFVDGAIEIAARIAEEDSRVYAPTGGSEASHALFDKRLSAELFESKGLPIPATIAASSPTFPLIAKPRLGSASRGLIIARSAEDLPTEGLDSYLLQEYIADAKEYTVDCFVGRTGRVLAVSPRRREMTLGGEATRTITVDMPRLKELSAMTLERLELRGAVTLQWLEAPDGRLLLMEINPRLGGGAVCSVHAGADLPGMIVDEAVGAEAQESTAIQPSVEIARYFEETVFVDGKLLTCK